MDTPQVGDVLESEDGTPMRVVDLGAPASPPGTGTGSSTPASPPSETGEAPQKPAPAEGTGTPAAPAQVPPSQEQPAPAPDTTVTPAPAAPAPAPLAEVDEDELQLTEDERASLERLDAFLAEAKEAADRRVASVQSGLQREINVLKAGHNEAVQALTRELREIKAQGVPEEELEALKRTWEIEDRIAAVDAREKEVDAQVKDLFVATLLHKDGFEDYGVTEEDLVALDDPDQMELFCKDAKIAYLEKHGGQPPTKAAGVKEAPKGTQPAPAPAPAAQPAPAGASAPADVGGVGAAPAKEEFSTEQSQEAMADTFSKLPKHRVRIA